MPCAHFLSISNGVPVRGCLFPIFLEGSYDGSAVFTTRENSSCIGFCGGYDYVLKRSARDVDGSVDAVRVINPSEVVMESDADTRFGLHKVSGVGRDIEDHVAGVEANGGVGICVEVVHEPVCLFYVFYGSFGLLGSYLVEGDEDAGVELDVKNEGAIDGLYLGDTFWV